MSEIQSSMSSAPPGARRRERRTPPRRDASADAGRPRARPPDVAEAWQVAAALVAAPSLPEQLHLLLEAAPRVVGADSATIFLRDDVSAAPRVIARYGFELDVFGTPRPGGMTERVLATSEPVMVDDATSDPRVNPVVPAAGVRSFVALPLLARGRTDGALAMVAGDAADSAAPALRPIGVLFVNSRQLRAFDPRGVEALQGLAALAGVAIENSYLLEAQRAAAEQLQEALRLREQFVSAAAHELKAPLTPVKGYAQAIWRRLDQAEAKGGAIDGAWMRRALRVMLDQVDRMDRMVTDLLDVTRLRAAQFTLAPEPVDLVPVARTVVERFRDAMATAVERVGPVAEHPLTFTPTVESLPGRWDPNRLDQLLTNLLGNAVKYSPHGGRVEVRVEPVAAVPVGNRALFRRQAHDVAPEWVHLAVRDEGIGLPEDPEAQEALFEPFIRGENAEAGQFSGFGLGLYICAEIARRHGGSIWAESPGPSQGTTFHVLLPPEAAEEAGAA